MNFKLPKIDIPDIDNVYNANEIIARFASSNTNNIFPDIPKIEDVDFNSRISEVKKYVNDNHPEITSKINEAKGLIPDMSSYMPDMTSYMPDISMDMSAIDIPKIESLGIDVPDYKELGIDTQQLSDLGVDTSDLDFDTSDLTSGLESFNMDDYTSDIDISSEMEMPDLSPKGIMKSMIGVEDPTDINGIVKAKMADSEPKSVADTVLSVADSIASRKSSKYRFVKNVASYADASTLDFSSVDGVLSNNYWEFSKDAIRGYIHHKVDTVKKVGAELSEFYSYVDKNELDFSSMDAIKNNDYLSVGKHALNGYLNGKLDALESTISSKMDEAMSLSDISIDTGDISESDFKIDTNELNSMSEFELDLSELESMGIDTTQFTIPDMNYDIPEINGQTIDFSNPLESIDMSQYNVDTTDMTKPIREMIDKYLS